MELPDEERLFQDDYADPLEQDMGTDSGDGTAHSFLSAYLAQMGLQPELVYLVVFAVVILLVYFFRVRRVLLGQSKNEKCRLTLEY